MHSGVLLSAEGILWDCAFHEKQTSHTDKFKIQIYIAYVFIIFSTGFKIPLSGYFYINPYIIQCKEYKTEQNLSFHT